MSPDASLHDFLGAQNARRRSRPGSPEWSSGPPEWSGDCARSGRGSFGPWTPVSAPAGVRGGLGGFGPVGAGGAVVAGGAV